MRRRIRKKKGVVNIVFAVLVGCGVVVLGSCDGGGCWRGLGKGKGKERGRGEWIGFVGGPRFWALGEVGVVSS